MKEEWKDIPGFEGIYQISNLGVVRSLQRETPNGVGTRVVRERTRKTHYSKKLGYLMITLKNKKSGLHGRFYVHRLVAQAFLENPENKPQINHKDGNKRNAAASNLEWVTSSENLHHAHKSGLKTGYWLGKVSHAAHKCIAIRETSIMDFPSKHHLARELHLGNKTVKQFIDTGIAVKNILIYSI